MEFPSWSQCLFSNPFLWRETQSREAILVASVSILAAPIWILSNIWLLFGTIIPHNVSIHVFLKWAYKWEVDRLNRSCWNFNKRIISIHFHALDLTDSRCSCQVQPLEKMTPRYLWELISAIWVWFIRTKRWYGLSYFLERRLDSDFIGLNVTSHLLVSAQHWILTSSKLNWSAVWIGSSTIIYKLVSTAKSLIEELMLSTKSFI